MARPPNSRSMGNPASLNNTGSMGRSRRLGPPCRQVGRMADISSISMIRMRVWFTGFANRIRVPAAGRLPVYESC